MAEIVKTVEIMECDYHRMLPPRLLMEHTLSAVLEDMIAAGGSRKRLFETCGAVWMISHMLFRQQFPLYPGDTLRFHVSPRIPEGGHYKILADVYSGEMPAAEFAFSFIPVHAQERHALRLSLAEPIWTQPPCETTETPPLRRLRPDCVLTPCGCDTVRMSDCDINHHMTSGAYLALACDALGFWDSSDARFMRQMQVDFASEVMPGTQLSFARGEAAGARYVVGRKPDGVTAFTARCVFD